MCKSDFQSFVVVVVILEPIVSIEVLKNQLFVDGFWLHWKLYNFQNIPPELISMEVRIGNQTWPISKPLQLSEYVKLKVTKGRTEVKVITTIGNVWNSTETVDVEITPILEPGVFSDMC